jgi:DNA repair protein RadC
MTIHDFPKIEKPREKMIKYGATKLSNTELLAIILRTGKKGKNVLRLSKSVFDEFGEGIINAQISEMKKIDGLGPAKACEIVACFELGKRFFDNKKSELIISPEDIYNQLENIRNSKKEHFVAFFLDSRNQNIKKEIISIGTLTTSLVHPREVFEPAIQNLAAQIILCHNHPSGNLEPSAADVEVTRRLIAAGKILGIDVLDHVIVSSTGFFSMKESNEVKF